MVVLGLIGIVVAALLSAAYFEIEATLMRAGSERAQGAADQLAELLATSSEQRFAQIRDAAGSPAIRAYLQTPDPGAEEETRQALLSLATGGQQRIELWTAAGELALAVAEPDEAAELIPSGPAPSGPGNGPLRAEGETIFSETVAEVPGPGEEGVGGYLVVRRSSTTAGSADVLGRLVGSGASVAIGSDEVWTDLSTRVPPPPPALTAGTESVYDGPDGARQVGAVSPVEGSPLFVAVGFPYATLVAPAVAFRTRMGLAAGAFIVVAMALTAFLTGRITRPLTDLTLAAEGIAAGRHVTPVAGDRKDEIGRLAAAFNRMNDRIHVAHERLELRATELAESEARKGAILESAMDAIVTMDHQGRIAEFNAGAERIFGQTREAALGAALADLLVPESLRDRHREGLARYLATGEGPILGSRIEVPALRADGSEFPAEVSVTRIPREGPPLFTGFIRDLTEHKEREQALRRSEARFQTISDSGIAGILVADLAGNVLEANDAFLEMVGYSREELAAGDLRWTDMTPPEWTDADQAALRALGADGSVAPFEKEYVRKDRTRLPILFGAAMLDAEHCIAVVHDITQRKEFEAERARSIRLEAENRRIEEANRLKSEFLANMSHELRTPLNAVIGFAELLHDGAVQPEMPEYQEFLGDILTSARHLLQLINDVLDLSKVEAGKIDFRPEAVDLESLVGEVVAILRTSAAEGGIHVTAEVAPEVRRLDIDAARLKQVLYNYLSNALKFTPRGGRVTVRAVAAEAGRFRLEVEDTGIGIAADDIGRLFTEFQQLDAGAAKEHAGTGLGLALTRRLVEAQGGSVGVTSTPGTGSTFWAVLPKRAEGGRPMVAPRSMAGARTGAPTILVVEDNPHDQESLVQLLHDQGYAVETASTAAQAVARCRERRFDAMTLDLLLPDGSGLDVLRQVRGDGPNREIPVVVVTVVTEPGAVAGFAVSDILAKPLDEAHLLEALHRAGVTPEGKGAVLVVDDDPGSLKLMVRSLGQAGFEARGVARAREGLEVAGVSPPLAVVLDLMMPEMDGFEFLDHFRDLEGCRSVPVIVWTVKDLGSDEHARLRSSAQSIIQKGRGARAALEELLAFVPAPGPLPTLGAEA